MSSEQRNRAEISLYDFVCRKGSVDGTTSFSNSSSYCRKRSPEKCTALLYSRTSKRVQIPGIGGGSAGAALVEPHGGCRMQQTKMELQVFFVLAVIVKGTASQLPLLVKVSHSYYFETFPARTNSYHVQLRLECT